MINVFGLTFLQETPGSIDQESSALSCAGHCRAARSDPWPFKVEDHSALAWWRMLPPASIGISERQLLPPLLRQIALMPRDGDLAAALRGDADAAIDAALARMPICEITLQTDIAMTAVLNAAMCGNATSSLVMAQVLGLTELDHPFAMPLAAAWFAHGLRHSCEPDKFYETKAVLTAAFREQHGDEVDQWFRHSRPGEADE